MDLATVFGYVLVFLFGVVAGRVWRGAAGRGQMLTHRVELAGPTSGAAGRPAPSSSPPGADLVAEVRRLAAAGNFLHAIKTYRDRTGAGLRESKEAVEAIMAGRVGQS